MGLSALSWLRRGESGGHPCPYSGWKPLSRSSHYLLNDVQLASLAFIALRIKDSSRSPHARDLLEVALALGCEVCIETQVPLYQLLGTAGSKLSGAQWSILHFKGKR